MHSRLPHALTPPEELSRREDTNEARVRELGSTPPPGARIPGATYRLQFHAGFTFRDARRLLPYLHALGITDLYASPLVKARYGSVHGYDVADPNALNPELGSDAEFYQLVKELRRHEMGQILDVVPNHMGIADSSNVWWVDVLENGPSSIYASFFDIDWHPLRAEVKDREKVVLPMLGDQYGRVLENGELRLSYADGAFSLHYYDFMFPIAPDSYPGILNQGLDTLEAELGAEHDFLLEFLSILTALNHLPPRSTREARRIRERNREKEIIKRRLARLAEDCPPVRRDIDAALEIYNGRAGDPRSFDLLDALLGEQAYRLALWRVASEEINYRRFFDINELAAVRMEDPRVFAQTHALLLDLVRTGAITGLRIDHVDGLWDPRSYLRRLQASCASGTGAGHVPVEGPPTLALSRSRAGRTPADAVAWRRRLPVYVVAEKILSPGERLPEDWPVHGTTGYDFLNAVNGIFVDHANAHVFDSLYARFSGSSSRFRDVANSAKKMVMLISMASEVNELGYELRRIAAKNRPYRDFTLNGLTFAIREIIASLSVYRTYIDLDSGSMADADVTRIEVALADSKRRNPRTDPSLFDFVRDVLLLRLADEASPEERAEQLRFIARFQQTSGPVMAKGAEDTASYVYNRLVSLNEVGGDPDQFGISMQTFHRLNLRRQEAWPFSMLASSTHDTKRSEDVRARINVLSEMPREWVAAIQRWSRMNARFRSDVDGRAAPDRNEEYLIYQILLGAWPFGEMDAEADVSFVERVVEFMRKALREAKVNTSWITPNGAYEAAVERFVQAILDPAAGGPFRSDFRQLQERVAYFGMFTSLSQTLLKLTSPGVPDLYQGTELWDFSLVDPDNRRPVDYHLRMRLLRSLERYTAESRAKNAELVEEVMGSLHDGRAKLYVIKQALNLRREVPELFTVGSYVPLHAVGTQREHVCAYARVWREREVLVAVPRCIVALTRGQAIPPLGEVWADTVLVTPDSEGSTYRDAYTGETFEVTERSGARGIALTELFRHFPVALLQRVHSSSAGSAQSRPSAEPAYPRFPQERS